MEKNTEVDLLHKEKKKIVRDAFRFGTLCCIWYALSAGENIIAKIILTDFPYPLTASTCHAMFITIALGPVLRLWQVPPDPTISKRYYFIVIVPLAMGKVLSSFSSQFSISKVPVSYAHTVKASMPIFTVLLSRFILGEKQLWKIYMSLIPIVGGIAIATVTEISFNSLGLFSALLATCSFSLQNIFSKKAMKDTRIHHLRLLFVLCKIATLFLVPVWLFLDVAKWPTHDIEVKNPSLLIFLLLIDCFCNFAHSMVAFTVISMVSPLSYSVANATKRIVVVSVSLFTLRNPVTLLNITGMMIAILGVLLYNKIKLDQARERRKEVLPTMAGTSLHDGRYTAVNLNQHSFSPSPSNLQLHDRDRVYSADTQQIYNYKHHIGDNQNVFRTHTAHSHNGKPVFMSPFNADNSKYEDI